MATPVEEFQAAVGVGDIRKSVTVRVVRDLEVRVVRDLKSVTSVTATRDLDL